MRETLHKDLGGLDGQKDKDNKEPTELSASVCTVGIVGVDEDFHVLTAQEITDFVSCTTLTQSHSVARPTRWTDARINVSHFGTLI